MGVQSIKSNPAMISLLVLVASAACAPQYGPPPPPPPTRPPPVPTPSPSPEKLIAPVTPTVACTVAYVTVWDTEYHDHENEVCETVYEQVSMVGNIYYLGLTRNLELTRWRRSQWR